MIANKEIWIAKRKKIETNVYGVDIEYFEKPQKYFMNYQPASGYTSYLIYGDKITSVYRAYVDRRKECLFNIGDKVYLNDGTIKECQLKELAENDNEFCEKANYTISMILPQNFKMQIEFTKI